MPLRQPPPGFPSRSSGSSNARQEWEPISKSTMSAPRTTRAQLVLVLATACFFVFAVLLYVRPLLEASSITPYRPVYDPYQHATTFVLQDKFVGNDFYSGWRWETFDDPTHGRVNYVDQATTIAKNLTFASDSKFVMRADNQNVVQPDARGRDSVRISSYSAYAESVIVLDVQHMPEGCSTWPAFWTLSQKGPWPHGGEIDIVEGVNQAQANLASLHTMPYCLMPQQRYQTGTPRSTNCDAKANFNQGCGTQFNKGASYGSAFNQRGGGYFVMARTRTEGVRVWFWQRDDPTVPYEVARAAAEFIVAGPATILPDPTWGMPDAEFPVGDWCDYDSHFDEHMMVFDLTFCGDWAGGDYSASGCPGNCVDFVNNNPDAFDEAYWEVNSLRVYTPQ